MKMRVGFHHRALVAIVILVAGCARGHRPPPDAADPGDTTYVRLVASTRLEGELEPCT